MQQNATTMRVKYLLLTLVLLLSVIQNVSSQTITLSIREVLQKVQTNLPALEAYRHQASAEKENVALTRSTFIPEINAGYQVNLATYNNITGMSYPGFLLPISGPPSLDNKLNFVPGSAIGALGKWNPFTFGQRNAAVEKANAAVRQANAAYDEQLFLYQYTAINLYLEIMYWREVLKSLQANIERSSMSLEQVLVLTTNGLRPGIDSTQFQSAIVQAEMDYLLTERTYKQKLVELKNLAGVPGDIEKIVLVDSVFSQNIIVLPDTSVSLIQHPQYQNLQAKRQITYSGLKEIQKSWVPQLDIWGNVYARGSGIEATGEVRKSNGFGFSRTNAGIGVQLNFPVLQYNKVNIRKRQYLSLLEADDARLAQATIDINKQVEMALMQYKQDIIIAAKSPELLTAANAVYEGLKISYETGLIDFTRLANAQYELQKAEVSNANVQLQLWRSLLAIALAKGNLNLFIENWK